MFDPVTFDLLRWAAEYYHHPIGEVMAAALPASLRGASPRTARTETLASDRRMAGRNWRIPATAAHRERRALLAWLAQRGRCDLRRQSAQPSRRRT